MFIRPPLVWEVRASPPRTNCPVTLVLPDEEPRVVSPLAKKRSPKRRINFKNDEQKQPTDPSLTKNSCEDGMTSWADMVKNGYQRSNNTSCTHSKSKENDDITLSKQRKHREYKENSNSDSSSVHGSNKDNNTPVNFNKETDQCCTEVCGLDVTRESSAIGGVSSPCFDNKTLSSEFSGTVMDTMNMKEDEGWEVVSRSRGKPSRRGFSKVQSVAPTGHTFVPNDVSNYTSEVEKGSCKQSHGHGDFGSHGDVDPNHNDIEDDHHVDRHDDNIDPDRHHSDIDPNRHHLSDIDPDQHAQHHFDNGDFDHSDSDPVDNKNYCAGERQELTIVIDNNLTGEDNNEMLQEAIDGSLSDVDTDRAVSPYLQVSGSDRKILAMYYIGST